MIWILVWLTRLIHVILETVFQCVIVHFILCFYSRKSTVYFLIDYIYLIETIMLERKWNSDKTCFYSYIEFIHLYLIKTNLKNNNTSYGNKLFFNKNQSHIG